MVNRYGIAELRALPRPWRGRGLLVTAALAAAAAAALIIANPWSIPANGVDKGTTVQTPWGPLSAQDRLIVVTVQQANLWEMPATQMARTRGSSQRVKDVAAILNREHMQLKKDTEATAKKLGVALPTIANGTQRSFVRELKTLHGTAFDKDLVFRLRYAHGVIFPKAAKARVQTQNTLIRLFTEEGMKFVLHHINLLDSTGLVTKGALQGQVYHAT